MSERTDFAGQRPAEIRTLKARPWLALAGLVLIVVSGAGMVLFSAAATAPAAGVAVLFGAFLVALDLRRRSAFSASEADPVPVSQPLPDIHAADVIAAEVVASDNAEPPAPDADTAFDSLFEQSPIGMLLISAEGQVERINRTALAMVGGREAAPPATMLELFAESHKSAAQQFFDRLFAESGDDKPDDFVLSGGQDRNVRLHGRLLTSDDAPPQGLFFLVDTTEQRSLEAQFAQGQRMQAVGQLAGGVAHDFNNLLTAMIGFADLLLMRHPPGDSSYADIVHIKQNANRAAALVRQLLAFSRRQTLRPKVLDLTELLTDLHDLLRRLIGEHLNIRVVHERDLGLVKADQGQVEQVVTNLVVNARDAMNAGGTVTIHTNNVRIDQARGSGDEMIEAGDYVEIRVSDTGQGIPEENLVHIFEPFFTTKAVGEGTGLGLATVYGIVRQTGGYIDVQSVVGEGTTISILLPRVAEDQNERKASRRSAAVDLTGSGTILLVEDEDAVRLFASRALRNKGYTLIEAESGEVALGIIEERAEEIDLMISDVVMPNMDGPTLIRRARELRPDIRAVFISGYAEEAFRRSLGDDLGDIDLLPKPFSLKQLAAKVKDQLEG